MVHTPVPVPKALLIPEAKAALDKEYHRLESTKDAQGRPRIPAWDITKVKSKAELKAKADKTGKRIHFGELMELCHLKNSQMSKEHQKYKGRVVFRGDLVKVEDGSFAVFTEQGTSASHMAAAKVLDTIGNMPGNDAEDADAEGAYTQVFLEDFAYLLSSSSETTETWITLPKYRWPLEWEAAGIVEPVVPLIRNLYGHPLAGRFWEKFSHERIMKCGFKKVQGWECLFVHPTKGLWLSVYVDDFKMAGPKKNIAPMWAELRKLLALEPPVPSGENTYLGCTSKRVEIPAALVAEKRALIKRYSTPQSEIPENSLPSADEGPAMSNSVAPVRGWQYDMCGHAAQCVDRYCELAKTNESNLKRVETPCIDDHQLSEAEFAERCVLHRECARIVLKILFLARISRPDLLYSVNVLAREVTKWTVACDKRLFRLISYIHWTRFGTQSCFVGDHSKDIRLAMFADASFAGDLSTSGGYLCLIGPNTFVPISWLCKKQSAVSHSSSEAEVISLDTAVRMEVLPCLQLWDQDIEVDSVSRGETLEQTFQHVNAAYPDMPIVKQIDGSSIDIIYETLRRVDDVPPSMSGPKGLAKCIIFDDMRPLSKCA